MTDDHKRLLRGAIAIHQQLNLPSISANNLRLPNAPWEECQKLLAHLRLARARQWRHAATTLQLDLALQLHQLRGELTTLSGHFTSRTDDSPRTTVRDIFADLVALEEEFGKVTLDRQDRTISVTTEPIELEGVYLGPFEIRLEWSGLRTAELHSYCVIAQDPQPAATNDSVTHPHVQDEGLCEGDGRKPIRKALEQGRLLDFFIIVANLLRTYNSGSPHVPLSLWHGSSCADCGSTVHEDELWSCVKCGTSICNDCSVNCAGCSETYCGNCSTHCAACGDQSCPACLTECKDCSAPNCETCLSENERCPACHEQQTEEAISSELEPECEPHAEVQPDRLGQTAVPA